MGVIRKNMRAFSPQTKKIKIGKVLPYFALAHDRQPYDPNPMACYVCQALGQTHCREYISGSISCNKSCISNLIWDIIMGDSSMMTSSP